MLEEKNYKIVVVPGRQIPKDQVDEIMNILSAEGITARLSSTVYIRMSAEELPPILVINIIAVLSGFVGAIGQDTWNAMKRALIEGVVPLLKKNLRKDPVIQLQIYEGDVRVIFYISTETSDLLQEALDKLPEYLDNRARYSGWVIFDRDYHQWREE